MMKKINFKDIISKGKPGEKFTGPYHIIEIYYNCIYIINKNPPNNIVMIIRNDEKFINEMDQIGWFK